MVCSWGLGVYIDDLDDYHMLKFWTIAGKAIHAMYIDIVKNRQCVGLSQYFFTYVASCF